MTPGYFTQKFIAICLVALLVCPSLYGWNSHARMTRLSLASFFAAKNTVQYIPLNEVFSEQIVWGVRSSEALLTKLKLNKTWKFNFELSEEKGRSIPVGDILSVYSAEPDQGADQNLFADSQYPELWTEDTKYISQREGLGSQGFRHMYFPGDFSWISPITSFQIPMRPLGEGPERAQLYFTLAEAFFNVKAPYWGYRFLAWALHYIQDLHNPYHVRQIPNLKVLRLRWQKWRPDIDIHATSEQIAYYHLSYEQWIGEQVQQNNLVLSGALAGNEEAKPIEQGLQAFLKEKVITYAGSHMSKVGKQSTKLFGSFPDDFPGAAADYVGTEKWKEGVQGGSSAQELLQLTKPLFVKMGEVTRRVVRSLQLP